MITKEMKQNALRKVEIYIQLCKQKRDAKALVCWRSFRKELIDGN